MPKHHDAMILGDAGLEALRELSAASSPVRVILLTLTPLENFCSVILTDERWSPFPTEAGQNGEKLILAARGVSPDA